MTTARGMVIIHDGLWSLERSLADEYLFEAMATTLESRPVLLEYRSSTVFIVLTVCVAVFTDIFLYGLVVPVIPYSINEQVGIPEDQVQQWTAILLACYGGSLFVASPVVGAWADRTSSRRLPLLVGLLALAAATLLLCLARTMALFVLARVLQGLSAGIVWTVGLALLADAMGPNVGYAMGFVNMAMCLGYFAAPVAGGAIYAAAGYYPVYYMAFFFLACDMLMRLVLVEKKVARQWLEQDVPSPAPRLSTWTQHPYIRLCRSRRVMAALLGCFLEQFIQSVAP